MFSPDMVNGNVVHMRTTNPAHYSDVKKVEREKDDVSGSFGDFLQNAIERVNNLQVDSDRNIQKMIYEPESIDIHTVMIAAQKAEIALSFTKAVRDEAVRAYRDLMNLR